jgi:hypothetical protein
MASYVTGDSGSFTFSGGESLVVADFGRWQAQIERKVFPTTPFGSLMERVTLGRLSVRGSFTGFFAGSTTPPIPANGSSPGTLTLLLTSGKSYSFAARIFTLETGANSITGEPSTQTYGFISCSNATTDTITVS